MIGWLIALLLVAAPGQLPYTAAQLGELKGERGGQCPDGSPMSLAVYDPDPSDSTAVIYVFSRGNVPVALREIRGEVDRVYIVAVGRWQTTDAVREQYPTPCDLPFAGQP